MVLLFQHLFSYQHQGIFPVSFVLDLNGKLFPRKLVKAPSLFKVGSSAQYFHKFLEVFQ